MSMTELQYKDAEKQALLESGPAQIIPLPPDLAGCDRLALALSRAQAKLRHPKKSKQNTHLHSQYADLGDCWDACRLALAEQELAVVQEVSSDPANIVRAMVWKKVDQLVDGKKVRVDVEAEVSTVPMTVTTTLMHSSGQSRTSSLTLLPPDKGPQAAGAVITYARKYALAAVVGLSPGDPDADEDAPVAAAEPSVEDF